MIPAQEKDYEFDGKTYFHTDASGVKHKWDLDEKKWVKVEAAKESSEDEESEEDDNTTDADRRARAFRKRKAAPGWGQAGEFMQNCACVKKMSIDFARKSFPDFT